MDRIKKILNIEKSKKSVNQDFLLPIGLNNSNKLLPIGDTNKIIDVAELANKERQNNTCYRFIFTVNSLFNNVLFDSTTGGNGYAFESFNLPLFRDRSFPSDGDTIDEEDLNYKEAIDSFLRKEDGWFGFRDPNQENPITCELIEMSPTREEFSLTPKNKIKNWEICLTYPSESGRTEGDITDGGLMIIKEEVVEAGKPMLALTTPVKHNLTVNDTIRIFNSSSNYINKDYTIKRVGLDDGSLKEYVFVIDPKPINETINIINDNFIVSNNTRMTRLVGGEESVYYYRKFKKITSKTDYETYPLTFGNNIYNDKITQIVFNEEIDVSNYKDNLNRPLSEVFLTFIKVVDKKTTNVKSGILVPQLNSESEKNTLIIGNIRRIHNSTSSDIFTSHTPLENDLDVNNDVFFGDIVEYNRFTLNEVVLGVVKHRFNRLNRETLKTLNDTGINGLESLVLKPRYEGYFYNPHNRIQIRDFSNYIEQGDTNTFKKPDYAEDLGDGRFLWRDFLDIGFEGNSGSNIPKYPFFNGCHYIYRNESIKLRRQDPFNIYGLYYKDFPRDNFGSEINNINVKINNSDDVC